MATSSQFTPVVKSELSFFAKKNVQCVQTGYETIPLKPVNSVTPTSKRLEFFHPGKNTDFYRNPSKTYLYFKYQIKKADGTALTATDSVAPINYAGQTFISSIEVKANGTELMRNADNHAFKSIFECALSSSAEDSEGALATAGFKMDRGAETLSLDTALNKGGKARAGWVTKPIECIGRLHGDLFDSNLYLPNGIDLAIHINLNSDAFNLWATGTGANKDEFPDLVLHLLDVTLYVEICHINPAVLAAHARVLQDHNVVIPINHAEVHAFNVAQSQRFVSIDNMFSGRLPSVLIIGMVPNVAFAGDVAYNPFYFDDFHLENLNLYVNGTLYAQGPFDFANGLVARGYFNLLKAAGHLSRGETPMITFEDFKKGFTIFGFDIGAEGSGGGNGTHSSLQPVGNVRLEAQFKSALSSPITIVVYSLREGGAIEIDKHRSVYVSF